MSNQQLHRIDQALWQGARAHGFDTDHWTLARAATVIERLTGVSYYPGHVWKLLRHRLDGRGSRHTVTGKAEEVRCPISRSWSTRCAGTSSTQARTDRAHEIYHDDAVLEFLQSGERFEGFDTFTEWRRQYPAQVRYRPRRITAGRSWPSSNSRPATQARHE